MARCSKGRKFWAIALALGTAACKGPQSALEPAGRDAERIASLFWSMAGGAVIVWAIVIGLTVYAVVSGDRAHDRVKTRLFVIGGGSVFPVLVLTVLLVYGLGMMPELLEHGREDEMQIRVSGEQWWWRVRYEMPDGTRFQLANELYLPVGRRIPLWLDSPDVIHSLWVPSLGGKIDMIPGRTTRMALEPTRTGVYLGVCAEYCGSSHAKMGLRVVVLEPEELAAWANAQAQDARPPSGLLARRGAVLFDSLGCGACHSVRGTAARGVIGPDLTHVGSRRSLAAGALDNDVGAFRTWLASTERVKPGVHMPAFDMLSRDDLDALATYLDGLR